MRRLLHFLAMSAAIVILGSLAASSAHSQRGSQRAVIVALPDDFPGAQGARAMIIRYNDGDQPDVVLLNPAVGPSAADLAAALRVLSQLRSSGVPLHTEVTTIQGFAPFSNGDILRPDSGLETVLEHLGARPWVSLGNIGRGRWIEMRSEL